MQNCFQKLFMGLVPLILVSGCLTSEDSSTDDVATTPAPPTTNSAPVITGSPPVSVTVGENYSFTPAATDSDGDSLTFQVTNLPGWASFSASNGTLTGVPTLGSVGMHNSIRITVSDGTAQSSLPQFGVEVLSNEVATGMAVAGQQPSETLLADVGTVVRVTFTAAVNPQSVANDSVSVSDRNGPIAGSVAVDGNALVFTPSANLDTGMFHSVQVASTISDNNGNSLGSPFSWSFTTSYGSAIPELALLEAAMLDNGPQWGEYMDPNGPNSQDDKFRNEFYGTANSFQRISEYLGVDEPWLTYADWGNEVFRTYLISTGYSTQGFRRFTHGMYGEHIRGDNVTLTELEMLRDIPAFSRIAEGRGQGGAENRSRAVALAINANVHAERAGSPRVTENGEPRLKTFILWVGSHLYEWRTGDYRGSPTAGVPRFSPFMLGITGHAVISYIEWERENGLDENRYWIGTYPIDYGAGLTPGAATVTWPTLVAALEDVASWAVLEAHHDTDENFPMWQPDNDGYASFIYQTSFTPAVATDLNLMIAPTYAWLWKETGDRRYRDWADQLFGAGALISGRVTGNNGKHFNQQFLYSFDYIRWRAEGDERWQNQ